MDFKQIFTSSVGKKFVMGFTGFFLIIFLVVHCYLNALVFKGDSGTSFNEAASFMGTNWIMHIMEMGLFIGIIAHIVQGLMLWANNSKKRPVKYQVSPGNTTSKWYSRSMGLLGTLILLFLIIHLAHFWVPNRYEYFLGSGEEINLYEKMQNVFANPVFVVVYILGCISLAVHLVHGFKSAFQSFGINHHKYNGIINCIGWTYAIIIPAIFAIMPIWFYLQK